MVATLVAAIGVKYNGRLEDEMLRADIECLLGIAACWEDNKDSFASAGWTRCQTDKKTRVIFRVGGVTQKWSEKQLLHFGGTKIEGGMCGLRNTDGKCIPGAGSCIVFERLPVRTAIGINAFQELITGGWN